MKFKTRFHSAELEPNFDNVMKFFQGMDPSVRRLLDALGDVIGDPEFLRSENVRFNYRIADYPARDSASPAPRCGEHRDFGPMTIIFQDGTRPVDGGGLQVGEMLDARWSVLSDAPRLEWTKRVRDASCTVIKCYP